MNPCRPKSLRSWLTEEVLDQTPVDGAGRVVAEDDDGSSHLAQAKGLGSLGEGVIRVGGSRLDLPEQLAVGQHLGVYGFLGPPRARDVEDSLVEDVVVAEEGVGSAEEECWSGDLLE